MKNEIKKYYQNRMIELINVADEVEFVDMFLEEDIFEEIADELGYDVERDFENELIEMKNQYIKSLAS